MVIFSVDCTGTHILVVNLGAFFFYTDEDIYKDILLCHTLYTALNQKTICSLYFKHIQKMLRMLIALVMSN